LNINRRLSKKKEQDFNFKIAINAISWGETMKPYQSLAVGPAEPSPTRPRPVGLSRARGGLSLLVLAFCLATAFLSPACAADGALDPSFITGPGPFAGVQTIPGIKGQTAYVNGSTGGVDWPYNGRSLLFGTFWTLNVGSPSPNHNCIARLTDTGALDATFLNNQNLNGEIRGAFIYPHDYPVTTLRDKILIWGKFYASADNVQYYDNLVRLNANGTIDTSFPHAISWGQAVNTLEVQGSGDTAKILVGGYNLEVGGENGSCAQLLRLNFDGSLDGGFTRWSAPGGYISSIKILPPEDPTYPNCVRIFCSYPKNQDGTGGTYYVLVLDPTVTLPSPSNPPVAFIGDETVDGPIHNWARQSNGMALIAGDFKHVNNTGAWVPRNRVARLGSDLRTLDTGYDVGNSPNGPNGPVTQISPVSKNSPYDDRMVLAGYFTTWNGAACGYLMRLSTTGSVDPTFTPGTGADDRIMHLNWNSDGSGGMIYGYFRNYSGQARGGIAGLNSNGSYNGNFANVTAMAGWPGMVYSLATQRDGKILIGGDFNGVGGKYRGGFARLNPNGSLDTSFKGGVDGRVRSVAVQADGKILLGGDFGQCQGYARTSLARLNPDGSLDTAFNPKLVGGDNCVNQVNQVVPLSNGQIMIAGDIYNNLGDSPVARLNSDGSLDASFFSNATQFSIPGAKWPWGSRVAVVGSKYLIAGGYETDVMWGGGFLARLTGSGALDTDFGPSNTVPLHIQTTDGPVDDLLLQPDGKIVVSGFFSHIIDGSGNLLRRAIARFSANGLLDTTFTPSLNPPTGANTIIIKTMALQPNGKILIEENFLNYFSDINFNYVGTQVARLNPNGSLDSNFTLGYATNGWFYPGGGNSILRLPNGKALIGGCYSTYNGAPAWSLVRIFAGPANFNPGALYLLLEN
jgi:uncharacterized delta-60 repeat protein